MNSQLPTANARRWSGWVVIGIIMCALLSGTVYWNLRETTEERARRLLAAARLSYASGDYRQAEALAQSALESAPQLGEAALIAARSAAGLDDYSKAVAYANQIVSNDEKTRIAADLLAADLCHHRLYRFDAAENHYRAVLSKDPDNLTANSGLASLLGLCGRGRETAPFILRVIKQGQPTDQLFLIARESGAINEPETLERAYLDAPNDMNTLLGMAWQAVEKEQSRKALELVKKAVSLHPQKAAAYLALGRQLLAMDHFSELYAWAQNAPSDAKRFGEYWLILGRLAEHNNDRAPAIRSYWEAIQRNPESKAAYPHLIKLLSKSEASAHSDAFVRYFQQLQRLHMLQDRAWSQSEDPSGAILELAKGYEKLGRFWEAYGWCLLGLKQFPGASELLEYTKRIRATAEGYPLQLTADEANPAMQVNLSSYPLPTFPQQLGSSETASSPLSDASPVTFRNDAADVGLNFTYFNGSTDPSCRRMFAFTGGGIGVLDFDVDGYPDVFFSQGRTWPPTSADDQNRAGHLFRNLQGKRFENISTLAGFRETGFGQGVSVGDINSDGFPDLYLANIGPNQLWINNGDGTFTNQTQAAGITGKEWTTSCLLADLSGDGLPDLYDVNYLKGSDLFDRVCQHPDKSPALCMPFDFDAEADRLWLNTGKGPFVDGTQTDLSTTPTGKGLGAAAWAPSGSHQLNWLVANDTTPNFLFVSSAETGAPHFREEGLLRGLACNGEGKAEGCMGIALADVDGNGLLDVHITNFFAESNTLWLQKAEGFFEDSTQALGLQTPTLNTLGFGTQFLDANLDGRLELFVTNGHIDDLRASGRPYQMPPQLFQWNNHRFVELEGRHVGPYFQDKWLGRAAAKLDWNRDGREDLLVGHLQKASALLTNTTEPAGQFLSLKLIGRQSSRDAIGTTVKIRAGDRTISQQLTAGDGYQASNERRLVFGIGPADQIDELTVSWLSGKVQTFYQIPSAQHLLLIEGGDLLPF